MCTCASHIFWFSFPPCAAPWQASQNVKRRGRPGKKKKKKKWILQYEDYICKSRGYVSPSWATISRERPCNWAVTSLSKGKHRKSLQLCLCSWCAAEGATPAPQECSSPRIQLQAKRDTVRSFPEELCSLLSWDHHGCRSPASSLGAFWGFEVIPGHFGGLQEKASALKVLWPAERRCFPQTVQARSAFGSAQQILLVPFSAQVPHCLSVMRLGLNKADPETGRRRNNPDSQIGRDQCGASPLP